MAGLSYAGSSAAFSAFAKTTAFGGLVEEVQRAQELLGEFEPIPWQGGTTINVKVNYAGNTSVRTYDEGDPPPTAVAQSYITASWTEKHYDFSVTITGHARDYSLNGSTAAGFFDIIGNELRLGLQDAMRKVDYDFRTSTSQTAPVGIRGIVDSSGTIAGLSRTTYTWFASIERACTAAGAIAITDLDLLFQELRDTTNDSGTAQGGIPEEPDFGICSLKVERKMRQEWGLPGAMSPMRVATDDPATRQLGYLPGGVKYGNVTFKPVHDFSNSEVIVGRRDTMKRGICRDWQITQLAKVDDSDRLYGTFAWGPVCTRPRAWGKLTSC